jgi:protein ImuB
MRYREIICVWFPNWPLQRLRADDARDARQDSARPAPVVIYRDAGQHGCRVVTFCSLAAECGVTVNMPLAEASALLPYEVGDESGTEASEHESTVGSRFELADPKRDHAALVTLAHSCQQYTPLFGVEESEFPESLLLDVTGCSHLFGGSQALVDRIVSDFQESNYIVRVAMAKTFGAAWAIAHFSGLPTRAKQQSRLQELKSSGFLLEPEQTTDALQELPISALRIDAETVRRFAEFDIFSIRQLNELPRTSLPSRFGKEVLLRLDQALGERPEILTFEKPPEPVQEEWQSEYGTDNHTVLLKVLDDLVDRICNQLSSRHQGTSDLRIWINNNSNTENSREVFQFAVRLTEPTSNPKHLSDLITLQLEREALKKQHAQFRKRRGQENVPHAFDAEFSQVIVRANSISVLARRPRDLFGGLLNQDNEKELRTLLDRLSNRLGSEAVVKANILEDPQPELTFEWTPFVGQPASQTKSESNSKKTQQELDANSGSEITRPLSLYPVPIPIQVQHGGEPVELRRFRCGRHHFEITTIDGPERIQTGWWRQDPVERDYFRVHTREHQQFWLFRCVATEKWFLQGVFD